MVQLDVLYAVFFSGTVYSSEGHIVTEEGSVFCHPSDSQPLVQVAMCASLCNDSTLVLNSQTGEITAFFMCIRINRWGLVSKSLSFVHCSDVQKLTKALGIQWK